jgi:hypothetical protein
VARNPELESAFDAAIGQVGKCVRAGLMTAAGESGIPNLQKLAEELKAERARALERGWVDREWFQAMVRWLVEWVPETELTLVAALGRIIRSDQSVAL